MEKGRGRDMLGNIIQMMLVFFWMVMIPAGIGMTWTRWMRRYRHSILMAAIMGWMTMFALAQLLAVPLIIAIGASLHVFTYTWGGIVLTAFSCSIFINRKRMKEVFQYQRERVSRLRDEKYVSLILVLTFISIVFQAVSIAFLWFDHYDDIRYVATAVDAYSTNTMLKIEPVSGQYTGRPVGEMWKDAVAPINIFWALLSKLVMTHPAIFMHMIVPFIFIIYAYFIFAIIGDRLFRGNDKQWAVYMLVLSFVVLYGHYGVHGNLTSSLMTGLWWGKGMQAALCIPFIFALFLLIMDEEENRIYYPALFCTMTASCLMTTMSAIIPTTMVGTYGLVHGISRRKAKPFFYGILCCLPNVCYGLLYYVVKGW